MPDNLSNTQDISTDALISEAKKRGVSFGKGNATTRLRYFVKLGLIPAPRRITHRETASHKVPPKIIGYYPKNTLFLLVSIKRLKNKGLSYEQIKKQLEKKKDLLIDVETSAISTDNDPKVETKKVDSVIVAKSPLASSFSIFARGGVSKRELNKTFGRYKKEINQRLKTHERNIINHIDNRFGFGNIGPTLNANYADLGFTKPSRFASFSKGLIVTTAIAGLFGAGVFATNNYLQYVTRDSNVSETINKSQNLIGQVLAATSDNHKLYIDADTELTGLTVFGDDITAPNVLYSLVGGTGITIGAGQTPTIAVDDTALVTTVNDLVGALTFAGSGATSITTSGSTITITSTDNTGDSDTTLSEDAVEAFIFDTDAQNITGVWEVQDNVNFVFGNDANFTLVYDSTTTNLEFTDGTNNLITIDDQGAYAFLNISDKGSTGDPVSCSTGDIYFNATDATFKGCTTANNWEAFDTAASPWTDGGSYLNPTGGEVINIGGLTGVAYSAFSDSGTADIASTDNDVYVEGVLEVDTELEVDGILDADGEVFIADTNISFDGASTTFTTTGAFTLNTGGAITFGDGGDTFAFSLPDNTTDALDIQESTNNYFNINTTNSSKNIAFGNATTNPGYSFLGSGDVTITGNIDLEGYGAIGNGSALSADSGLIIDYDATYTGVGQQLLVLGTVTGAANTNVYGATINPESITIPTGTTTLAASLYIDEPNITETGTLTSSASLYIAATATEGTANYGIYTTAASNSTDYSLYSGNGNVSFILGAADKIFIDGFTTTNTGTNGVLDINVTSATNFSEGLNVSYSSTATGTSTNIAGFFSITNSQNLDDDVTSQNYGLVTLATTSGTDTAATTATTINTYGIFSRGTGSTNTSDAEITLNIFGGYFRGTGGGSGGSSISNVYGIYSNIAIGGDNSYGAYITDAGISGVNTYGVYIEDITIGSGDEYGIYIAGADDYAIYVAADDIAVLGNLWVGSTTETISDGSFAMNGNDVFISGQLGIEGDTFVDNDLDVLGYGAFGSSASILANTVIEINESSSDQSDFKGLLISAIGTSSSAQTITGTNTTASYSGTGTSSNVYGIFARGAYVSTSGSPSVSTLAGILVDYSTIGSAVGSVTNAYGIMISTAQAGGIKPTSSFGLGIKNQSVSGITNSYGISIDNQTGGTNVYGLHIAGADDYAIYVAADPVYIAGSTEGIDALTIAAGDITLTDGDLDIAAGDLLIANNEDLTLGSTGVRLSNDGDGAITFLGLGNGFNEDFTFNLDDTEDRIVVTSSTGISSFDFSGIIINTSRLGVGGVDGNSVWGIYNAPTISANCDAINLNCIGVNTHVTVDGASQSNDAAYVAGYVSKITFSANGTPTLGNAYGLYILDPVATDIITNVYGIIIADQTSGTNNYGIYIEGATDYAIYSAADDIFFGLGTSTTDIIDINATTHIGTAGVLDIDITSATNGNSGINLNYTAVDDDAADTLYGLKVDITIQDDTTASDTVYGQYIGITQNDTTPAAAYGLGIFAEDAGTSAISVGILIENLQTTDIDLTAGVLIRATTNGSLPTGIDVSDAEITDAISIGANAIAGTNFSVDTAGEITTIFATTGSFTAATCWDGTGASTLRDCVGSVNADYAEIYPVESDIEYAELVSIGSSTVISEQGSEVPVLAKSSESYQANILGITSDNYGDFSSTGYEFDDDQTQLPIALSGRVPLKVTTQNGNIRAGDSLTSSNLPGIAMKATKAGRTIGIALGNYSSDDFNSQGIILVFVEPSWYMGTTLASNGSVIIENPENNETLEVQIADLSVDEFGVLVEDGYLDGQLLTAEEINKLIAFQIDERLAELGEGQTLGLADSQDEGLALGQDNEASSSSDLADETQENLDELDALLATNDLQLDTLVVTGDTLLASTQVAGTFSQDGTLIIDYGKQINVLGSTLFLQNDGLAGDELGILLDIGGGKVTVDSSGNLTVAKTLIAQTIQAEDFVVNITDDASRLAGKSTITSGQSQITINSTIIKPNAIVLITPVGQTFGQTLYLAYTIDYEGFTVAVDSGSATSDLHFNWLIINTQQLTQKTKSL